MQLSVSELAHVVRAAAPIGERAAFVADQPLRNVIDREAADRLGQWKSSFGSDEHAFGRRLRQIGVTESDAPSICDDGPVNECPHLPDWCDTFRELLEFVVDGSTRNLFPEVKEAVATEPFQEIIAAFASYGYSKLLCALPTLHVCCSEAARKEILSSLTTSLLDYCGVALQRDFDLFKAARVTKFEQMLWAANKASCGLYEMYIGRLLGDGLLDFFTEYPVLARILSCEINAWVQAVSELIERVESDRAKIRCALFDGKEIGAITSLQWDLSDRHNGARTVSIVGFNTGESIVYKPRCLGFEETFYQIVDWFNSQDPKHQLFRAKILKQGTYGWMQFVEDHDVKDAEAAHRYYWRAGALLCLVYLLRGNDCHAENLIAHGEHPVLVDLETLFYPERYPFADYEWREHRRCALQHLRDSVLSTGLLPNWEVSLNGTLIDNGGFSSGHDQLIHFTKPEWKHVNTDKMEVNYSIKEVQAPTNCPKLNGEPQILKYFLEDLREGFTTVYSTFLANVQGLLGSDGPLHQSEMGRGRWLFRDTKIYASLIKRSLAPELMSSGFSRSVDSERLGKVLFTKSNRQRYWPLHQIEQDSIANLEVPRFQTAPTSRSVWTPAGEELQDFFAQSGIDLVHRRIQQLSLDGCRQQCRLIEMAVLARYSQFAGIRSHVSSAPSTKGNKKRRLRARQNSKIKSNEYIDHAIQIGESVARQAYVNSSGGLEWIAMQYVTTDQRDGIRPLGFGIYDGHCGIALVYASLAEITGEQRWMALTLSALQPLLEELIQCEQLGEEPSLEGLGGASGAGGIIYSLVHVGRLLKDESLLSYAMKVESLVTPSLISQCRDPDVLNGLSGLILGLLSLQAATQSASTSQRLRLCGTRILELRRVTPSGCKAWVTLQPHSFFTGFAHGAAGIASTLARLSMLRYDNQQSLWEAALEGMRFERSLWSDEKSNWAISDQAVTRQKQQYTSKWCYGAAGIALARMLALQCREEESLRSDLDHAIAAVQADSFAPQDGLCCGNLGIADILLAVGRGLDREDLLDDAHKRAARVFRMATDHGGFRLFDGITGNTAAPGLFQGLAGAAYAAIRLSGLGSPPNVLSFEY